jgi:ABC-2 type transport system permease protein
MAGVAGTWAQAGLILELRWWLLRNSIRTARGQLELLGQTVAGIMGAMVTLAIGVGLAAVAYAVASSGRLRIGPSVVLWVVFFLWQFGPILLAASGSQFDFRGLLHFPLRFRSFWLLSVLYGVFDPTSVGAFFWLACIATGTLAAEPGAGLGVLLVLVVFAAMNVLLSRAAFAWLERILATRRAREMVGVLFLLVVFTVQFVGPALADRWGAQLKPLWLWLEPLVQLLPPGLAGHGLEGALRGEWADVWASAAGLAGYALGCGLLFTLRVRAQYRGEELSEAVAPAAAPRAGAAAPAGWKLPGLSDTLSAVVEKEVRYAMRSGPTLLNLAIPILITLFFGVTLLSPRLGKGAQFFLRLGDYLFPIAVFYSFMVLSNYIYNVMAFDAQGTQLWFSAPVSIAEVLKGKNLAHAALVAVEATLAGLVVTLLKGPPAALVVLATLTGLAVVLLANYTVGNLLSLYFPKRWQFGVMKQQRISGWNILFSFLMLSVVMGGVGLVFAAAAYVDGLWVAALVYLLLGWIAWRLYAAVLVKCEEVAQEKKETLLAELCKT